MQLFFQRFLRSWCCLCRGMNIVIRGDFLVCCVDLGLNIHALPFTERLSQACLCISNKCRNECHGKIFTKPQYKPLTHGATIVQSLSQLYNTTHNDFSYFNTLWALEITCLVCR